MKHAKRMVLVPEDVLNRYEQKQKLETSPIVKGMMQEDSDMSRLLYREDLNDDEKQKLYHANLERYLNFKHQKDSKIPTVRLAPSTENKEELPPQVQPLPDDAIVEHIPKTFHRKATAILNRLKARPDAVSWDETGQVSVDGVNIPRSNISDLISDALRERKSFNPTGAKEFFRVLSKINMPTDLVGNKERWRQAVFDSQSSGEEEIIYSPRHASSSKNLPTPLKREKDKPKLKRWLKY